VSASGLERAPSTLPGVGPARAAALARLGLERVRDLLYLVPRRLERTGERRSARAAAETRDGEVAVVGTLRALRLFRTGPRRTVLALEVADESGALRALFFNQPWLHERLRALAAAGTPVELSGRVGTTRQGPALLAPRIVVDPPAESVPRLEPVYPTGKGIGQELLRKLVRSALERHGGEVEEPLDAAVLAELALPALPDALAALHSPTSRVAFGAARRRLAFERLLALAARLAATRTLSARTTARPVRLDAGARDALVAGLPFRPTAGQARVLDEILSDLARPQPMRRLLQGEVGAGKTLVALAACAAVARSGGQAALLAPTELLAEQHHLGLAAPLARFGLAAALVTGSQRARERKAALAELASGRAALAIGTHALLSRAVEFARLDLVVVDEQQRFGVAQKQALLEKGADVHALLMTATPIPRTLALCWYGDLAASLLAERPPGRGPLETRVVDADGRAELVAFLAERARAGERVFWVCPRILPEEDDGDDADESDEGGRESPAERVSAEEAHARLARGPLAEHGVELVHGRIDAASRARAIERFRSGAARVLVGTAMIEVGIDVPEATAMVIEGAERFGLSQLHQLRGRVGRSHRPSWCFLLATGEAGARLRFLEETADGFRIAEEDLRRRGMGDLAGIRQAGENLEGLGDDELDLALVAKAHALVRDDAALRARYLGASGGAALV
jgi:ATP-dependent DNA helicase RecG